MPIKFELLRDLQALVIEDSSTANSVSTITTEDNIFLEKEIVETFGSVLLVAVHNPRERVRRYLVRRDKLVNNARVLTREYVLDDWKEIASKNF